MSISFSRADLFLGLGAFALGALGTASADAAGLPAAPNDPDATTSGGTPSGDAAGDALRKIKKNHPRLIATPDSWDKIKTTRKSDPLLDAFLRKSEGEARAILSAAPVVYKKEGKRLLHVSRMVVRRVLLLALHFHLTGDPVFAKRADEEMQAVCAFADWNPSHFLDVGEMCLALALGYDWLYDALPVSSRKSIETAIAEKALVHGLTTQSWQTATNNWNSVCWGGLTLGALAIADVEPEKAAQIVRKAVQNNGLGLKPYAPDGVYPEGAMYWGYGTTFQVILLAGLQSALGTDFGLSKSPGFLQSGSALLQQAGPTGLFFNFSDNTERPQMESGMWWFAHTLRQPGLLTVSSAILKAYAKSTRPPQPETNADRLLPLAALWWTPSSEATKNKEPLSWYGHGPNPLVVFRNAWNDKRAMFLALKGGSASQSHGHMDAGSFVFEASGVRWACDLGMQSYLSLESKGVDLWNSKQDGQRWDVFRLGPFSHSTLTINGRKHHVDGAAKITHFGEKTDDEAGTIVDLSPVFSGQAQSVVRGFAFHHAGGGNGGVLIKDEIAGLKAGDTVRWAMLTRAAIVVSPDGKTATLTQSGETLAVSLGSSVPAKWEIASAEVPPKEYDAPNPGVRLLVAHFTAPASGKVNSSVTLQPGALAKPDIPWAQAALAEWPLPPVKISR